MHRILGLITLGHHKQTLQVTDVLNQIGHLSKHAKHILHTHKTWISGGYFY